MTRRVLVAGATGQMGRWVVTELKRRGDTVRALVRDPSRLGDGAADETATGDLTRAATLAGVCQGVDCVISCAGASMNMNNYGDRNSFYEVDYQGNRNLLAEAKRAGVKKFVYVSLSNADRLRQTEYADAHEKFVEELRQSGLPFTIVRPTGFYGFYLEILKFAKKGRGVIIGDGRCLTNPIHEADVARVCVDALDSAREELPVGGPDTFTRQETVELAFAALDRKPSLMKIPPGLFRLLISPIRLINRRVHALMDFGVAVTQLDVVAPQAGGRRLRDYFQEAAKSL
jgi:uncharacterized protein YbjT (DUF2867 family)